MFYPTRKLGHRGHELGVRSLGARWRASVL